MRIKNDHDFVKKVAEKENELANNERKAKIEYFTNMKNEFKGKNKDFGIISRTIKEANNQQEMKIEIKQIQVILRNEWRD